MAIQQLFTGTAGKTDYIISEFEFLKPGDIDITVGTDVKTSPSDYSIEGSTIKFTSVPTVGATIKAERSTDISTKSHTYTAGSSITAQTLNDNQDQALFKIEEVAVDAVNASDLAGDHTGIHVSSNGNVWTINDDTIDGDHLKDNIIEAKHIKPDAVGSSELANDAVDTNAIINLNVTTGKIADDAVTYPKLQNIVTANRVLGRASAGEVQEVQVVTDMIANTAVTKDKIANTAIDKDRLHISGPATVGHILTYSSGSPGLTWATPNPAGSIIETISYNCDGVSFTHGGVTYNSTAVSAAQTLTTSYADITGSTIAYTPPSGTTKVIYEFRFVEGRTGNTGCLFHMKMFLDSDEVTKARYSKLGEGGSMHVIKWTFPIGGSADTTTGRVATWTSSKTIKLQARDYNTDSYKSKFHETTYWDGNYGSQLSLPTLTLTAIA